MMHRIIKFSLLILGTMTAWFTVNVYADYNNVTFEYENMRMLDPDTQIIVSYNVLYNGFPCPPARCDQTRIGAHRILAEGQSYPTDPFDKGYSVIPYEVTLLNQYGIAVFDRLYDAVAYQGGAYVKIICTTDKNNDQINKCDIQDATDYQHSQIHY